MTTIRRATHADIPEIVRMAVLFYATTEYAPLVPFDEATVGHLAQVMIEHHLFLVAGGAAGEPLLGMVGMFTVPFTFNRHWKMAAELVWYVDPAAQRNGLGMQLLHAMEDEGVQDACQLFQMMTLATSPKHASDAYLRDGYVPAGNSFLKVV